MGYIKYLSVLVLALLLVSFIPKEKHRKVTLPSKALLGHVQFVREITYHAIMDSTGSIIKGNIVSDTDFDRMVERRSDMMSLKPANPPIETWTYDEFGDEIESAKYHSNGKLCSKEVHTYYENGDIKEVIDSTVPYRNGIPAVQIQQYTYKYDSAENLLSSNKWEYYAKNSNTPLFTRIVNVYDAKEKLLKVMTFNADTINPVKVIWHTYNEKGKLVETDERRREGDAPALAPFEKNDFWYDTKGRLYDKATYHPNGLVRDEKTTFDSMGKTITIYSYGMNRVLTGTVEKRIFNATNTTQEDTYNAEGSLTDYTISHDSAKHLMDRGVFHINYRSYEGADRRYYNAEPLDTIMLHHIVNDKYFNVVVDDNFSYDGKAISQKSYEYNYDSVGNWIGRVQFNIDNKPVRIVEREIDYFKE